MYIKRPRLHQKKWMQQAEVRVWRQYPRTRNGSFHERLFTQEFGLATHARAVSGGRTHLCATGHIMTASPSWCISSVINAHLQVHQGKLWHTRTRVFKAREENNARLRSHRTYIKNLICIEYAGLVHTSFSNTGCEGGQNAFHPV